MLSESLWISGVCWEDWWFSGFFVLFFNYSFYFHEVWSVYPFIFLSHRCRTRACLLCLPALFTCHRDVHPRLTKSELLLYFFYFCPASSSVPTHKMVVHFEGGGCGIKRMGPCNESTNCSLIIHHKNNHTVIWMAGCSTTVYYGRCSILLTCMCLSKFWY